MLSAMDVAGIADLAAVISLLRGRRFVVLSGAGVSTDSGIPDYRGPGGAWRRSTPIQYQDFLRSAATRRRYWARSTVGWPRFSGARPNAAHQAVTALERAGLMTGLITQNVDGLHQAAGSDPSRVVEVHGTVHDVVCLSCGDRAPMGTALDRVRAGEADPACLRCGGILKSATISFGQNLVEADLDRAFAASAAADLFLAVGTSLGVYPVAHTVTVALGAGVPLVIVNAEPTPFDDVADVVLRAPIGEVLPRLVRGASNPAVDGR